MNAIRTILLLPYRRISFLALCMTNGVVVGTVLGGYTHIVLDGLMHGDSQLLTRFSTANPFQGLVSLGALHWFYVYALVFGLAAVAIHKHQCRRRAHPIWP